MLDAFLVNFGAILGTILASKPSPKLNQKWAPFLVLLVTPREIAQSSPKMVQGQGLSSNLLYSTTLNYSLIIR